jgi:hypothetical protein
VAQKRCLFYQAAVLGPDVPVPHPNHLATERAAQLFGCAKVMDPYAASFARCREGAFYYLCEGPSFDFEDGSHAIQ